MQAVLKQVQSTKPLEKHEEKQSWTAKLAERVLYETFRVYANEQLMGDKIDNRVSINAQNTKKHVSPIE